MNRLASVLFLLSLVAGDEDVVCTSTLDRHSCPEGLHYRDKIKSNNYCPGCVQLKELNEECMKDEECAPGLSCSLSTAFSRNCLPDPGQECEYYKRVDPTWRRTKYWTPDCLPNGRYAEKQCKGEMLSGKCFCMNEMGRRIFGEAAWMDAENMTCACSRLVEEHRKIRSDLSLHCDENGNFEALQCDDGICWCANERTGIPYTPVVPESMTRILPCFEEEHFGSQYLRRCDSSYIQTERAVRLLKNHGFTHILLPVVSCNYDGSYARLQRRGVKKYCSYKDRTNLTEAAEGITDCNCEYDRFVARSVTQEEFHFECDYGASYKENQSIGNVKFKVDSDGCPYDFEPL